MSPGIVRIEDTVCPESLNWTAVVLIPVHDGSLTFSVTGQNTGNVGPQSATFIGTWHPTGSGTGGNDLITNFLGLTRNPGRGPSEPFGAFGGACSGSNCLASAANGYLVYTVNMGAVTFGSTTDPILTANGTFGAGTIFLSYATCATVSTTGGACSSTDLVFGDTAPSSPLLASPTPEPASIALFGSGLAFLAGALSRRIGKV